ncbi:MAG TPA: hemin uptake protein HemP [Pirellulaceae bacterium]|jgi:hemin uptake protein HemP|nr:hemin uptake protein HemP [Pirellulaceae bacterium]
MPEPDRRTDGAHGSPDASGVGAGDPTSPQRTSISEEIERSAASGGEGDGSIDFLQLAQGRREVLVRLAGQTYRLRWTRNDKLILTK